LPSEAALLPAPDQRNQLALRRLGIVGEALEGGDRLVEHGERRPSVLEGEATGPADGRSLIELGVGPAEQEAGVTRGPEREHAAESFFLARRLADDSLESAGSVSTGLAGQARERLRADLQAVELPHQRRRQRVRPVEPAIIATVEFHGRAGGPVRDAVTRLA
jgi:hypothetical protein